MSRVTAIADKLGLDFALIHRKRGVRGAEAPEQMELLVGDVRDKVWDRTFVPLLRPHPYNLFQSSGGNSRRRYD